MAYDKFIQKPGGTPRKVANHSNFKDPILDDGKPHGNSRRHGDADPEVQKAVIDSLLAESAKRGLTAKDAAIVLSIARIESGFNPDAAAGTTSASGIGQFIEGTGKAYGLNDSNRFDIDANAKALVSHYIDNKSLAQSRRLGDDHIYRFHHDGPSKNYGGLGLSRSSVMPVANSYMKSDLLADFGKRKEEYIARAEGSLVTASASRDKDTKDTPAATTQNPVKVLAEASTKTKEPTAAPAKQNTALAPDADSSKDSKQNTGTGTSSPWGILQNALSDASGYKASVASNGAPEGILASALARLSDAPSLAPESRTSAGANALFSIEQAIKTHGYGSSFDLGFGPSKDSSSPTNSDPSAAHRSNSHPSSLSDPKAATQNAVAEQKVAQQQVQAASEMEA